MNYVELYNYWLNSTNVDEENKAELEAIKGNDNEIKERFFKELEFGTGGLRGVIGAGINHIKR